MLTPKVGVALTLASIAAIGTAVLFIHARRVYPSRRCPRCGYDRTHAESEVCTECGVRPSSGPFRPPPRSTIGWITLLCIATLAWPGYKAYRWSEARGWTPPLPAYEVEIIRTFPTGHVAQKLLYRNTIGPEYPYAIRLVDADGAERLFFECPECGWSIGVSAMTETPDDLDDDGFSDAIFIRHSCGTQCWYTYSSYRLYSDGRVVHAWNFGSGSLCTFADVDDDGLLEVRSFDNYKYVFACGVCLIIGADVTYELEGAVWKVDPEAMRTPPPDQEAFDMMKRKLLEFDWSEEIIEDRRSDRFYTKAVGKLWIVMLDLVYTGNGQTAVALLDAVWPEHLDNRTAALAYFIEEVREYTGRRGTWEAINGMQDPPVDWPAFSKE
ncbi:hypothetical protein OAL71_01750 [Phycisphaerales bacterium]|nr:hypothetical protein [Phycisphaerales bacterium]